MRSICEAYAKQYEMYMETEFQITPMTNFLLEAMIQDIPVPWYIRGSLEGNDSNISNGSGELILNTKTKKSDQGVYSEIALFHLNTWFDENITNPYPSKIQKDMLQQQTSLTIIQISNWFSNKRRRDPRMSKL